jgi:hypothetical protein
MLTGVLIGLSPGTESLGNAGCVGMHLLHLHINHRAQGTWQQNGYDSKTLIKSFNQVFYFPEKPKQATILTQWPPI